MNFELDELEELELTVFGLRVERALAESGGVRLGSRPAPVAVERSVAVAAGLLAHFEALEVLVQMIVDALEELVVVDELDVTAVGELELGEVQVLPDVVVNVLEVFEIHFDVL